DGHDDASASELPFHRVELISPVAAPARALEEHGDVRPLALDGGRDRLVLLGLCFVAADHEDEAVEVAGIDGGRNHEAALRAPLEDLAVLGEPRFEWSHRRVTAERANVFEQGLRF